MQQLFQHFYSFFSTPFSLCKFGFIEPLQVCTKDGSLV